MWTVAIFLGLSASVAGHTLLVHYSRQQPGPKYSTSKVVLLTEALKLIAGLAMMTRLHGKQAAGKPTTSKNGLPSLMYRLKLVGAILYRDVMAHPREAFKTCVPSFLYALQNNLVLVSLSNLDAATFLVTSQLKIFFTAFFMWVLMGRTFSRQQCFALALLCVGEALVHWETLSLAAVNLLPADICDSCSSRPFEEDETGNVASGCGDSITTTAVAYNTSASVQLAAGSGSYALGLSTAFLTCVGSGFAGVYLEIVLKNSASSFWIRNVQLYIWGIVSNGIIVIASRGTQSWSPAFDGFNELTVLIIVTSALVGFCTAIIIQRLDNIWKNLASSAAVVMAMFVSALFYGTSIGFTSAGGTLIVIAVPWLYHTG